MPANERPMPAEAVDRPDPASSPVIAPSSPAEASAPAMVHIVGAGCGAADLITVRGLRLLERADVVVWAGSLVNPELLASCKPGCEIHDSAHMTLEQVLEVMVPAARAGREVVRLHTGDPSVYGAIREQMDALDAAGIPYDVTPGVSSFAGAAAALHTELTLPGVSQTVMLTRVEGRTPMPAGEGTAALAAHGSTMVFFLSAGLLERLQAELLAAGRAADEPAAIVYKATWPDELVLRCTVGTLAATGSAHGIHLTALVLVGKVLAGSYQRSKLYDPAFATLFRAAEGAPAAGTSPAAAGGAMPNHDAQPHRKE